LQFMSLHAMTQSKYAVAGSTPAISNTCKGEI